MTIIDFMMAHPFISLFMVWAAGSTVSEVTHHISNTISIRSQLKRGVPVAQVVQLKGKGKKRFVLQLGGDKNKDNE